MPWVRVSPTGVPLFSEREKNIRPLLTSIITYDILTISSPSTLLREADMLKTLSTPVSLLLLTCGILIFTGTYAFINRYQLFLNETQFIKFDTFTNTMTVYRGTTAEEVNLSTGTYRNYNIIKTQ